MIRVPLRIPDKGSAIRKWAAMLADTAGRFDSGIMIEYGSTTVNAKSMLGLLTAVSGPDGTLVLVADGADEEQAIHAILALTRDVSADGGHV